MDTVAGLQLFIRVVETGSFSKASADLGITQPTATKHVAALEARLGARLFHRSTRGVTPTEVGTAYYDKAKAIARQLEEADSLAALMQSRVQGSLRISTSVAFGRRVLTPLVLRFMQQHPGLQIDLSFDDRYVNLVEQGIDVAIRMGRLADSTLGASYLAVNPWLMAAAPSYLAARGAPQRPEDLEAHDCIVYSSVQGDARWHVDRPGGATAMVPVQGPLRSNNLSAVLAACRDGLGLAILPGYVAREALADGSIVPVMTDHALPSQEVHAVYPSPRLVPRKVTGFIGWLRGQMAGEWWARAP